MSKFIYIILGFFTVSFSASISDFAPVAINNHWVYLYKYGTYPMIGPDVIDSLTISIQIVDISGSNLDTIVALKSLETGHRFIDYRNGTRTDTNISNSYDDTVFIHGDTIYEPVRNSV
jgi:hypothetical protein